MQTEAVWSVHWVVDGALTRMAAVGASTAGYVGVGFSPTGAMVGSYAIIGWCGDGSVDGDVGAYYMAGKHSSEVQPTTDFALSNTSASCIDGEVTIRYTLDSMSRETLATLDREGVTQMLWALGESKAVADHYSAGALQLSLASGAAAALDRPFEAYRWHLIHAILMFASWGVLLPFGALIPRFLKQRLAKRGLWFKLHKYLQSVGLLVSLAGLAIVFARPEFGSVNTWHGYLGLAVIGLGVLQPLNAFVRPPPSKEGARKSHGRLMWEILHKGVGWGTLVLAAVTIFLGIPLYSAASGSRPMGLGSLQGLTTAEVVCYFWYGGVLLCFLLGSFGCWYAMRCCATAPHTQVKATLVDVMVDAAQVQVQV